MQRKFTLADWYTVVRWYPIFLLCFFSFAFGSWLRNGGALPGIPWSLALFGSLTALATLKNKAPLVLGLGSLLFLIQCNPLFGFYVFVTSIICHACLCLPVGKRGWPYGAALVLFFIILPKSISLFLHTAPSFRLWYQDLFLQGLLLRHLWFYREWKTGRSPLNPLFEHLGYLFFLPQQHANLNFPPSLQRAGCGISRQLMIRGFSALGLGLLKLILLKIIQQIGPDPSILPHSTLYTWIFLTFHYLKWFLYLSSGYDLAVALCRFLGADIPLNFNLPLLAASPAQFWRRWSLFNRGFLLEFVYFPLGGRSHPVRNTVLVFFVSVILFHAPWLAGQSLLPNPSIILPWLLFAMIHAIIVCLERHSQTQTRPLLPSLPWIPRWLGTQFFLIWSVQFLTGTGLFPGDGLLGWPERFRLLRLSLGLD